MSKKITTNRSKPHQPPPPGGYETVSLAYEVIKVAACQMVSQPIDPDNPGLGIAKNLDIMLGLIDRAAAQGCQLMVFPEFTLNRGGVDLSKARKLATAGSVNPMGQLFCLKLSRQQWLKAAIMVPGPETRAIGEKAQQYNCYVSFSSYTQQPDWPGHFFNASIIVGPSGDTLYNHWKNYWGYPGIGTEYATRVFDVLDEYVERYGWDAVWPVARTPIGNLAGYVCSEGHQSETSRILAFYGTEIFCRNFAGGGKGSWGGRFRIGFRGDCAQNLCWGVYANNGYAEPEPPEQSWAGGSMIVDPYGNIAAEVSGVGNEIITATIPIAEFRSEQNRFDEYHNPHMAAGVLRGGVRTEITVPVYQQFPGQFPPGLLTKYQKEHNGELPSNCRATREWYFKHARWHLPYHDPAEYA